MCSSGSAHHILFRCEPLVPSARGRILCRFLGKTAVGERLDGGGRRFVGEARHHPEAPSGCLGAQFAREVFFCRRQSAGRLLQELESDALDRSAKLSEVHGMAEAYKRMSSKTSQALHLSNGSSNKKRRRETQSPHVTQNPTARSHDVRSALLCAIDCTLQCLPKSVVLMTVLVFARVVR